MSDVVNMDRAGWLNEGSLSEALARLIGEMYDGYADPIDTPNNWNRAMDTTKEVLALLRKRHLITDQGVEILKREGL